MTTYSLLGQTGTPNHLDSFTGQLVNGTVFTLASAAVLTGIWMYSFSGAAVLPNEVGLYDGGGSLLWSDSSPGWSGAAGSGWVKYATSHALAAGTYTAAAGSDAGATWYAITNSAWGPVTAGPLSCTSDPNTFSTSGSFSYPGFGYGDNNIWLDIEVTVSGAAPDLLMASGIC